MEEIKFLGHRISVEGITTDPEKVKAIQEFPTPKNCKQLKSCLLYTSKVKDIENSKEKRFIVRI